MLLIEAIKLFIKENNKYYKETTLDGYYRALNKFYQWNKNKNVEDISQIDIDNFFRRIEGMLAPSTQHCYKSALVTFFEDLVQKGLYSKLNFPTITYKRDIKAKYISIDDYNKMVDSIHHFAQTSERKNFLYVMFRDLLIIQLLIETGIKMFELLKIDIRNKNFLKGLLILKEKQRPDRKIELSYDTINLIKQYLKHSSSPFFHGLNLYYKPISAKSIEVIVKYHSNGKNTPKDFRHTFILNSLVRGYGMYEVSDLAGGLSQNTTRFYREEYDRLKDKLKITEGDYFAFEYLKIMYGKSNLDNLISSGQIVTKYNKEMIRKLNKERKVELKLTKKICPYCGKDFLSERRLRKVYCSYNCRVRDDSLKGIIKRHTIKKINKD